MKRKMTTLLTGAILLLAACNKDKRKEITTEKLAGTYKVISSKTKVGNQPPQDDLQTMDPCKIDDLLKLNSNMTFNGIDAGLKCAPLGDYDGLWSLPSPSQIIIDGDTWTIKSFNSRTLVMEHQSGTGNNLYHTDMTIQKL